MSVNLAALGNITFTGLNGSGSISAPGLKVGDALGFVYDIGVGPISPASAFEAVISTADQIQQLNSGDLSTSTFLAFFFRVA